jgi:hypothetical protein
MDFVFRRFNSAGSDKLTITLRFSKIDQLGKGVNIEIPKVGGLMCPFESVYDL